MAIEVTLKKTEQMTVAFASMKGPYSLIGETFGKLYGWIGEKGFVLTRNYYGNFEAP